MKHIIPIILISFLTISDVQSQQLSSPEIWLKAEYDSTNLYPVKNFNDSEHFVLKEDFISFPVSDMINGYPSIRIDSTGKWNILTDKLLGARRITTFIAYQPTLHVDIVGLWCLQNGKSKYNFLTNKEIGNGNKRIPYTLDDRDGPIVNSSIHVFDKKTLRLQTIDTLHIASADNNNFTGKVSEFIVLKGNAEEKERSKWQTYLCLKYGVTMHKGNYINSYGDSLWVYENNQDYSYGVGGLGRDDSFPFNQQQSSIWKDSVSIGIHNIYTRQNEHNTILKEKEFLLWGHNEGDLDVNGFQYYTDTATYELWDRKWMVKPIFISENNYATTICVSIPKEDNLDLVRLFINRENEFSSWLTDTEVYAPDSITGNKVWFNNIHWDTDNNGFDYFTFGYASISEHQLDRKRSRFNQGTGNDMDVEDGYILYELHPNPTKDEYKLHMTLKEEEKVTVTIKDVLGRHVNTHVFNGNKRYILNDRINWQGVYYFEIETKWGKETLTLIVNP